MEQLCPDRFNARLVTLRLDRRGSVQPCELADEGVGRIVESLHLFLTVRTACNMPGDLIEPTAG